MTTFLIVQPYNLVLPTSFLWRNTYYLQDSWISLEHRDDVKDETRKKNKQTQHGILTKFKDRSEKLCLSAWIISQQFALLVLTNCEPASHVSLAFMSRHPFQIALISST